jgi:hypothetical protein
MYARFAGTGCGAYTHVLQAHDGPDVIRLENVHAYVGKMRA